MFSFKLHGQTTDVYVYVCVFVFSGLIHHSNKNNAYGVHTKKYPFSCITIDCQISTNSHSQFYLNIAVKMTYIFSVDDFVSSQSSPNFLMTTILVDAEEHNSGGQPPIRKVNAVVVNISSVA